MVRWPTLLALAMLSCVGTAAPEDEPQAHSFVPSRKGETQAQALYRHGINCMEVYERDPCAIDYFEQLVAGTNNERELVGDALLRLVKLYERNDRVEDIKPALRRFWDAGIKRATTGVVPYSARFMPADATTMIFMDVGRATQAPIYTRISADAQDIVFTCDEARKEELRESRKDKRETRRAEVKVDAKTAASKKRSRPPRTKLPDTIQDVALCPLARALGSNDHRVFRKMASAFNHSTPTHSMAALSVDELDTKIRAAEEAGLLARIEDRRWILPDLEYYGDKVEVASLDQGELLLAPAALMPGAIEARRKNERTLNPEIHDLSGKVPRDATFFMVLSRMAMRYYFAEAGTIGKFLPTPDGLLLSAVAYDYAGIFVRMPTTEPLKMWALVTVAQAILTKAEEDQNQDSSSWQTVDISKTSDNSALVMSLVFTRDQIERMLAG